MLKSAEQSKHAQLAETLQAGEFCGNTISIGTGAYSATRSVCAVVAHCSKKQLFCKTGEGDSTLTNAPLVDSTLICSDLVRQDQLAYACSEGPKVCKQHAGSGLKL